MVISFMCGAAPHYEESMGDVVENIRTEVTMISPLYFFELQQMTSLELEPGMKVRRITAEEKSALRRRGILGDFTAIGLDVFPFVAEETTYVQPGSYPALGGKTRVDDAVLAMRLLKPGQVSYGFIFWYESQSRPSSMTGTGLAVTREVHGGEIYGGDYILRPPDELALKKLWAQVRKSTLRARYGLAVDRLDDAYHRNRHRDRLIDSWIALDHIFSQGLPPGEYAYRVCLRIAHFLGQDADDRAAIYKDIHNSYKCRSAVVHGGRKNATEIVQASDTATDCARSALRLLLDTEQAKRLAKIDDTVVRGNSTDIASRANG